MSTRGARSSNSFRSSLTGEDLASQLEPFQNFSDADLERVAKEWRARADRGERDAFGVAHDCEVELRRRQRAAEKASAPPTTLEPLRRQPSWKFWRGAEQRTPSFKNTRT